jgi:hypothetical protein
VDSNGGFFPYDNGESYQQVSEEVRVHSSFDFPVNFLAGMYYVAESLTGRLWAYDIIAPGKIRRDDRLLSAGGRLVATLPDAQIGDSLAIDSEGHICLGSLPKGAIFRTGRPDNDPLSNA